MKKQIPNIFTMFNMLSGLIALIFVFENQLVYAAYFVFLGIFFDFFDGFFARLLKVQSPLGVQLDSLADLITSGVVPGMTVFKMLSMNPSINAYVPYIGLLLSLAAGFRLAKFNIDSRQTMGFIGLPTPAMSIFIMSIPLVVVFGGMEKINIWIVSDQFLIFTVFTFSYLMNSELPIFSLKFKSLKWEENEVKFVFLLLSVLMLLVLKWLAIPIIIIIYILFSVILYLQNKVKSV